jgi:hydrogenase nickel incorporation protein HypA/HybF
VHELSVCQGLLRQVDKVAREHEARGVDRILLRVGALSGVEPDLLSHAFEIARMGTLAENADLDIEHGPAAVRCRQCGGAGEVPSNRLVCPVCGDWRVEVTGGEELLLMSLDLDI